MSTPPLARIAVGVVVERRAATSPWIEHVWRPVGLLAGVPETAAWTPVPGAVKYQVEVNTDDISWAGGSKVCCSDTFATTLTPKGLLPNAMYGWRVRAIDASGYAGAWTVGTNFSQSYDSFVTAPPSTPSVANLWGAPFSVVAGAIGCLLATLGVAAQTPAGAVACKVADSKVGTPAGDARVHAAPGLAVKFALPRTLLSRNWLTPDVPRRKSVGRLNPSSGSPKGTKASTLNARPSF